MAKNKVRFGKAPDPADLRVIGHTVQDLRCDTRSICSELRLMADRQKSQGDRKRGLFEDDVWSMVRWMVVLQALQLVALLVIAVAVAS